VIPYFTIPTFKMGVLELNAFGALVTVGFLVGSHLAVRRARIVGLAVEPMYDISLLCLIFGFTVSHIVHMVAYYPRLLIEQPWTILKIWSGISSFGGFLGASVAIWIFVRRKKLPFLRYADALLFGLVPGWLFGRLGCTTAHDHPGRLTHFFLAVKYPGGARHDLGFYEAVLTAGLVGLVYYLGRRKSADDPPEGTVLAAILCLYGTARFLLDFLRATDLASSDVRYFGLTPAQYGSIACVVLGAHLFRKIGKGKAAG
jgi:phosphatidylglycerol:prolipoprotein diacylglycerol transferase